MEMNPDASAGAGGSSWIELVFRDKDAVEPLEEGWAAVGVEESWE